LTVEQLVTTAVNAPAEQVWRLFVDVEHWPEITPHHPRDTQS
jgi:uncharacterized membrane protein